MAFHRGIGRSVSMPSSSALLGKTLNGIPLCRRTDNQSGLRTSSLPGRQTRGKLCVGLARVECRPRAPGS